MSKYIDMADQIIHAHGVPCGNIRLGIRSTLSWLDDHPGQVPGRTITESELGDLARTHESIRHLVGMLGITVIPDPEPTNFEKLTIYLGLHDLDAITQAGVADFARQLDADGVKAPGGDDE